MEADLGGARSDLWNGTPGQDQAAEAPSSARDVAVDFRIQRNDGRG